MLRKVPQRTLFIIWLCLEWHLLKLKSTVIPAKAGIHMHQWWLFLWIPAFAGMTIN